MRSLRRRYMYRSLAKEQQIERQAAEYLVHLYAGDLSAEQERAIFRWRAADPKHEYAFSQQQEIWLDSVRANDTQGHVKTAVSSSNAEAMGRSRYWGVASIAASVILMLALMTFIPASQNPTDTRLVDSPATESSPNLDEPRRYLITAAGEVDTVRLSDGSQLTLNSSTVVEFMFNPDERKVRLIEGEAFFDVVPDPHGQRPFVITNGEHRVEVVGTQFNVRARNQRFELAVIEGQVNLFPQVGEDAPQQTHQALQLGAGSYADINPTAKTTTTGEAASNTPTVAKVSQDQGRVVDAQRWRDGVVRLDNVSLSELLAEFNRYHSDKLRIGDEQAADLQITGVFHLARDKELMDALVVLLPIRIETSARGHTLYYHPKGVAD